MLYAIQQTLFVSLAPIVIYVLLVGKCSKARHDQGCTNLRQWHHSVLYLTLYKNTCVVYTFVTHGKR